MIKWLSKLFKKEKKFITIKDRRKELKGCSKKELIRMITQNELVIAKMMDKFDIKDIRKFL